MARQLRNKKNVQPEYFESVSVLFSDIPVFQSLAEKCSPFELIALLHGLYSTIDDIIPRFDVYKVETISDSYMVNLCIDWLASKLDCIVSMTEGCKWTSCAQRI